MKLQNYTSRIEVDGKPLEEFTSSDGRTVTCWIASEEGKNFVIYGEDSRATSDSSVAITLDGQSIGHKVVLTALSKHSPTFRRHYANVSQDISRTFVFSKLELSEEESSIDDYAKLGTIAVAFHDATFVLLPRGTKLALEGGMAAKTNPISERSKKAGAHCVGLGEEVKINAKAYRATNRVEVPSATFIFKYRPLELLVANDLAPATLLPTPPPSLCAGHDDDAPIDLDPDDGEGPAKVKVNQDYDTDAARLRALEDEMKAIKARHSQRGSSRPNKRVKREPLSHKGIFAQGEVIDLTSD